MRPFFSFFGSKWRAAPHYPPPLHETIVEPFAGSAGYSLRYHQKNVILVEKDPLIYGLWRWLIEASPEEILALPLIEPGQTIDDLDVRDEAKHLIGFWLNKGKSSPAKSASSWLRDQPSSTTFWGEAVRERVADQVNGIRHWTVLLGDYHEAPNAAATWFIDPPYHDFCRHYQYCEINYSRLADWCRTRPGFTIVCECLGAEWLPFQSFRRFNSNQGPHRAGSVYEAIYCRPYEHSWSLL